MLYRTSMRAVDSARNIRRWYALLVDRDLFGFLTLQVDRGRIGTRFLTRTESFEDEQLAQRRVRQLLSRRRSARKRIGVEYEILDEFGTAWLTAPSKVTSPGKMRSGLAGAQAAE